MAEITTAAETTAPQQKSPLSTQNHLRLLEYKPENYGGIKDQSIVVLFPDDEPLTELSGDQGTTKSSNIACLKTLLGAEEPLNAINSITEKKSAELTFSVGNRKYTSRVTKTGFTLTEIQEMEGGGKPIRSEIKKPKDVLRQLIGPLGSDPNFLKSKDPKNQLAFIRTMVHLDPQFKEMEAEVDKRYNETFAGRTAVNKSVTALTQTLSASTWHQMSGKIIVEAPELKAAEEKYSVNLEERDAAIMQRVHAANVKTQEIVRVDTTLKNLSAEIETNRSSISYIRQQIATLQDHLETIVKEVEKKLITEATLKEQLDQKEVIIKEQEDATKALQDSNQFKEEKRKFETSKELFTTYQEGIQQQTRLNKLLSALAEEKKKLIKDITPAIEDLEVCVPSLVDEAHERQAFLELHQDAGKEVVDAHIADLVKKASREGIFYKGRSVAELSESELWDLWLQLCKVSGIKAVFIENISSLGSTAIERINELASQGCNVFYSAMLRGQQELKITFHRQIK